MLAIHNYYLYDLSTSQVANAFAKLSKCQQFTTLCLLLNLIQQLQTLLQSYQNVSNSQLKKNDNTYELCCKRFCKVIKMLAIHNQTHHLIFQSTVANAFAKLSKCQQFTTIFKLTYRLLWLQTLLQSYQNVSNSQLQFRYHCCTKCCKRFCKVIKMLAIHNVKTCKISLSEAANAFAKLSKCQQFTTICL